MSLILTSLVGIPHIRPGDDLTEIILACLDSSEIKLRYGDILVIAQKILSKSENRLVNLTTVKPSQRALELAKITTKDARFIELVLTESSEVLRARVNTLIVRHKLGFICANAGIDHSNVQGDWGQPDDWVLLLPENPDLSAEKIRLKIEGRTEQKVGVLIIDSHGRAWRNGTVGTSIGLAGMPGLMDLRGTPDLFGFRLKITQVGVADELAAAASLLMGQANEGSPVIHVRGFPYPLRDGNLKELMRPADQDLFL